TPLASARYARIRRLHSHPTCPQSLSPGTEASSDHRHSPTAPVTLARWVPEASFRRSGHHHTLTRPHLASAIRPTIAAPRGGGLECNFSGWHDLMGQVPNTGGLSIVSLRGNRSTFANGSGVRLVTSPWWPKKMAEALAIRARGTIYRLPAELRTVEKVPVERISYSLCAIRTMLAFPCTSSADRSWGPRGLPGHVPTTGATDLP